jgi:hypothetical protein
MATAELSFDEDLPIVFRSSNHDAEWEAQMIHGILVSAGIDATVVGTSVLPSLEFQVRVPEHELEDAKALIAAAELAGNKD